MSQDQDAGTLVIVREIHARPEAVFNALTRPEELARWWTGIGGMKHAEIDLRPGGAYRFEFRMPEGKSVFMQGKYRVVDPPKRFEMTWISPKHPKLETLVSFELEPIAGGTRLTLKHTGLIEPDAFRDHQAGWLQALSLLLPWLAAMSPILGAKAGAVPEER
ncbi:MAG TPA: SRPBCC domain-containing protein [Thermoanaerobaculia bacterium]|nr:SRPBCC domain-containing protein [Thermoanaerobaculia bacterium]